MKKRAASKFGYNPSAFGSMPASLGQAQQDGKEIYDKIDG